MSGTTQTVNGFNVGSDTKVSLISGGAIVSAQIVTEFDYKQITTDLKDVGIDGQNRYRYLEEGWEGSFQYDKADDTVDAYFAQKEANRYAGLPPPVVTITQTDNNADGSIAVYRFQGVTMTLSEGGNRTGDAKVNQRVAWRASRRIKVQ